jgi:N-acetylneuraminate synthase
MKFVPGQKTYVIAEIGANHNGDMALAKKLIEVAKDCGADAAKFQSWDTTIFSKAVYEKNYFLGDDYRNRSDFTLKEIVQKFALSFEQMRELRHYCAKVGIDFATTPFSVTQLEQLVALDPPFIKIASMDLTNPRLLKAAGRTRLPVVLSTGFGTLAEIDRAVRIVEGDSNRDIVLLHCIALYPPADDEVNLDNMDMLRAAFGYPVGFSDHTAGAEVSLAAMAKRAVVLEKHFTLDKTMFGWDHHMSVDPDELRAICRGRDRIHAALGTMRRVVGARELARRDEYRRSIVAARDIRAGETITEDAIDFRRPGTGLDPFMADIVVGMVATRTIAEDTLISLDDLAQGAETPRASSGRS